jgi:hypothetical protein
LRCAVIRPQTDVAASTTLRNGERYKLRRLRPQCRRVSPFESVEKMPIPIIQQILHLQLQQDDENEDYG